MIRKTSSVHNHMINQLFQLLIGIILISSTIIPQEHLDESFQGSYREKPKTSIVRNINTGYISRVRKYDDLLKLLIFLPKDVEMRTKYPDLKINGGDPEKRKTEELFNVEVECWVIAVKYEGGEGDRDFHVIVGDNPDTAVATYLNVEVSSLPPSISKNYQPLRDAREQFIELFSDYNFTNSFKYINPPRKVKIKGSLFFDGQHNHSCRTCPGPAYAKPGTVWEIHPIYSIVTVN
jgi:hypothetical protein